MTAGAAPASRAAGGGPGRRRSPRPITGVLRLLRALLCAAAPPLDRQGALARATAVAPYRAGRGWSFADAVRVDRRWICVLERGGEAYVVEVHARHGTARIAASAVRPAVARSRGAHTTNRTDQDRPLARGPATDATDVAGGWGRAAARRPCGASPGPAERSWSTVQ